jgi:hypothetical protein
MFIANQALVIIAIGAFTGYLSRYYPPTSPVVMTLISFALIWGALFPAIRKMLMLVGLFYALGLVVSHLN